ncbi:MAG: hypothetical protein JNL92_20810 [Opitutaceae bacterium]|nr:hypothetical protein [Opitutaceae bacterium]
MLSSRLRFTAVLATFAVCSVHPLSAIPITGMIDFSGGATFNTPSLSTASSVIAGGWSNVTVTAVTAGSILDSTINPGAAVTMTGAAWSFNNGALPNLWTVGGFTFNLTSSAIVTQNASFLNVQGTGFLSGNGYDVTPGNWYFTSQGGGDNNLFSFSASNDTRPAGVPEGGSTVLMLGGCLLAGAALHRLRRASECRNV